MSKSEADRETRPERSALQGLESAVSAALDRIETLEDRLEAAEARRDEVEELLRRMSEGEESPARMAERLKELEAENADLRHRVDEGFAGVERLLAQIRFLEEQS